MGLIGAMIAFGMRHRSAVGDAIRGIYIRWAIYIVIFGLLPGFNIDNAAHIGGLAGGFGACLADRDAPATEGAWQEKAWRVAAVVVVLLTVYCFFKMFLFFSRIAPTL